MTSVKQKQPRLDSLAAIVSHPLRARSWTILSERSASPLEISRELGEDVTLIAYHVKVLREMGVIELVETRPRRGSVEHYYVAVRRPAISEEETASLSLEQREGFARHICQVAFADAAIAAEAGSMCERPNFHLARTPLQLDEEGWRELNEAYGELVKRALDAQAASANRAGESETETFPVASVAWCFPMPRRPAAG